MERVFLPHPLMFIAVMMALGGPVFLIVVSLFGPFVLYPDDAVLGIPAAVVEGLVVLLIEWGGAIGLLSVTKPLLFMEVDEHEVRMVSVLGVIVPSFVEHIPHDEIFKVEGVTQSQNEGETYRLMVYRKGIGPHAYNAPTASTLERAVALLQNIIPGEDGEAEEQTPAEVESLRPEADIAPWANLE